MNSGHYSKNYAFLLLIYSPIVHIVANDTIFLSSLQKPVRCTLDRDEDMMITGTRHPFLFKYKVAFSQEGLIKGLEVHIYANVGCSLDLSGPVRY